MDLMGKFKAMGVGYFPLLVIYFTSEIVQGKGQLNLHAQIEKYSGYVDTSVAYKSFRTRVVYECVSDCFLNANSSFYFRKAEKLCYCYAEKLDLGFNTTEDKTAPVYGFYLHGYQVLKTGTKLISKPRDCLSIFESGFVEDGKYFIYPSQGIEVITWCDMTNGGWTVIQRRQDGSVNFFRPWNDYAQGFGNVDGEFWLGLENIHRLTQSPSSLEIKMEAFEDVAQSTAYAKYSSFWIEGVTTNYILHVDGFSGDCGDSLTRHDGYQFSTSDRDNDDGADYNCAAQFSGAWWYEFCHSSNLNGLYLAGNHTSYADGINWRTCWGYQYSVKTVVMKVRRSLN